VQEIARMLGGVEITQRARAHALEMMSSASLAARLPPPLRARTPMRTPQRGAVFSARVRSRLATALAGRAAQMHAIAGEFGEGQFCRWQRP